MSEPLDDPREQDNICPGCHRDVCDCLCCLPTCPQLTDPLRICLCRGLR